MYVKYYMSSLNLIVKKPTTNSARGVLNNYIGLAPGWSWVRILLAPLFFGTLAIPFPPLCQCLSKEILKAVVPFYLVSMRGEVKDPTQGVNRANTVEELAFSTLVYARGSKRSHTGGKQG